MSTITTRAGKGSPLTNAEVDANFTNLNTDKAELSGATFTGDVASTGFSGDITGAILFQAKAGEALTKGDPVYISGISGNQTVVSKADANDANKMPCFGIVDATVSINANCSVVTFGTLSSLDTSAFGEGDELYISDTGTLSTTAPTGEASQLQKIAKVTRSHASAGSIKVMGAGRTNATPNLDDGKFFLGNSSNQSASATFSTSVTGIALPLSGGAMTGAITTNSTFDGRDVATDGTKLDGIEASADVTDTANVTAAGALMDSELTSIASVKALNQGVATTDSPTFAGLTTSADVSFGDNDKAIFGAGSDLQIYHDGSNSYIDDAGTGNLRIRGSQVILEKYTGETILQGIADGSVYIFHDNAEKLATTSTGIDVTGTATMDSLNVDSAGKIGFNTTGTYTLNSVPSPDYGLGYTVSTNPMNLSGYYGLAFATARTERLKIANNGDISFYEDTGTTAKFFWDASAESLGIGTSSPAYSLDVSTNAVLTSRIQSSAGETILEIDNTNTNGRRYMIISGGNGGSLSGGKFGVFDATAGATRLAIDPSGNVGIGTSSPSTKLHLGGTAPLDSIIRQDSTVSGTNWEIGEREAGKWQIFEDDSDSVVATFTSSGRVGIGTSSPSSQLHISSTGATTATIEAGGGGDAVLDIKAAEASGGESIIRFSDSVSGVGFITYAQNDGGSDYMRFGTASTERMRIDASGNFIVGATSAFDSSSFCVDQSGLGQFRRDGTPLIIRRDGGDGGLIDFEKDGASVGSIGTVSGDIVFGTGDTGLRFYDAGRAIQPRHTNGTAANDVIDLGMSTNRFKDLYLSGGVYLGGTGAANKLDDYEEGTFSPSVSTNSGTISMSAQQGTYVKVGDVVHYWIRVVATCTSTTVLYNVDGLPFSTAAYSNFYAGPTIANVYHVALGTNATVLGGYYLNNTNSIRLHSYGNQTNQLSPSVSANVGFELRFEGSYRLTA